MVGKGLAHLSHKAEEKSMTRNRDNLRMPIPKGAAASHNIPLSGKICSFEESVREVLPSPSSPHVYSIFKYAYTHTYALTSLY